MKGVIKSYNENEIIISAPFDPIIIQKQTKEVTIQFEDGRKLHPDQRKKAYAILKDIGAYNGDDTGYLHEIFKQKLCNILDIEDFSLSNCSVTIAREYINLLIGFCLEWGVASYDSYLTVTDDTDRFLWSCLYFRKCCICGKQGEYHHATGSKIGMGRNRNKVALLGTEGFLLCRTHHIEAHQDEIKFCAKNHVHAIKLDERIVKRWQEKL